MATEKDALGAFGASAIEKDALGALGASAIEKDVRLGGIRGIGSIKNGKGSQSVNQLLRIQSRERYY